MDIDIQGINKLNGGLHFRATQNSDFFQEIAILNYRDMSDKEKKPFHYCCCVK